MYCKTCSCEVYSWKNICNFFLLVVIWELLRDLHTNDMSTILFRYKRRKTQNRDVLFPFGSKNLTPAYQSNGSCIGNHPHKQLTFVCVYICMYVRSYVKMHHKQKGWMNQRTQLIDAYVRAWCRDTWFTFIWIRKACVSSESHLKKKKHLWNSNFVSKGNDFTYFF